ncbi:CYTH domain-containing protein [Schleiferiaceae bacterium]|jgi:CYTH domain-containing protein|nr:CYTH domain-containing protein [Bacteroidota bacterium]MCO4775079.1 CYTH domain-containing protein [Flavobacteriales bacterium]MDA8564614.1 CYTH domain-containing protein [Schleiferiaceae bacterium]MCH9810647.1 CYTH domain-containing protein [Bacteroidota bacterium]MDA8824672.1 CYTH domain-containing protein [Schleiferiaceae bacterium]
MAKEIERKFLVAHQAWRESVNTIHVYRQGYLSYDSERTVRVRATEVTGYLTIKGITEGLTRDEFEYEIPLADALALLQLCERPAIEKKRYIVPNGAHVWEVDVFEGVNEGLVVAEIELGSEDEAFDKPNWLGNEVSGDRKYSNSALSLHPFKDWSND